MRRPKVLVAEAKDFSSTATALVRSAADVVLGDLTRPELLTAVGDADVLWTRLRHRVDAEVLDAAPRLRTIVTPTTGLTHLDLGAVERRGIDVLSLRGETAFLNDVRGTAEHTLALMLALLRRLPAAVEHARQGAWDRDAYKGRELHGKQVGILGYGRLGRMVGQYVRAFGASVLACDLHSPPGTRESDVRMVTLPALLQAADIVTLHASYSPEARGLIGGKELATLRRGAWFINTARGELVDETALLAALTSGHLAGAALDVIAGEPGVDSANPLLQYARTRDNLIVTPHIGGCTEESMEKTECFLAQRLAARLASWSQS